MKKAIYDFLIFCSGSNPIILNDCKKSEHIKHAGFGTLVLIPAILALFTMTYAISTFTEHWYFYYPAGICWALIVFAADRFLVSTFRKSNNPLLSGMTKKEVNRANLSDDILSLSFFSRLLLAGFIGVGIAHPFTLLYFHKDINQKLISNKIVAEKKIRNEHDINSTKYDNQIYETQKHIKCLQALLLYEQAGTKVQTECGASSEYVGFKGRADTIKVQIVQVEKELKTLLYKDSVFRQTQSSLKNVELTKADSSYSNGYNARENALIELENEPNSNTRSVRIFLIFFLVLIDILAVTWKAITKKGPYDEYLLAYEDEVATQTQMQLNENRMNVLARAEFNDSTGKTMFIDNTKLHEYLRAKKENIKSLLNNEKDFRERIADEYISFGRYYRKRLKEIGTLKENEARDNELQYLKKLKESFYQSLEKALENHNKE